MSDFIKFVVGFLLFQFSLQNVSSENAANSTKLINEILKYINSDTKYSNSSDAAMRIGKELPNAADVSLTDDDILQESGRRTFFLNKLNNLLKEKLSGHHSFGSSGGLEGELNHNIIGPLGAGSLNIKISGGKSFGADSSFEKSKEHSLKFQNVLQGGSQLSSSIVQPATQGESGFALEHVGGKSFGAHSSSSESRKHSSQFQHGFQGGSQLSSSIAQPATQGELGFALEHVGGKSFGAHSSSSESRKHSSQFQHGFQGGSRLSSSIVQPATQGELGFALKHVGGKSFGAHSSSSESRKHSSQFQHGFQGGSQLSSSIVQPATQSMTYGVLNAGQSIPHGELGFSLEHVGGKSFGAHGSSSESRKHSSQFQHGFQGGSQLSIQPAIQSINYGVHNAGRHGAFGIESQDIQAGSQYAPYGVVQGNSQSIVDSNESRHSTSHGISQGNSQSATQGIIQGIQLVPSSSIAGNIRASGHSSSHGSLKHNSQLGSQAVIQGIQLVPSSSIAGNIKASSHSSSHGSLKHNSQLGSKAVIQGFQLLPSSSIAGNIRASSHSSSHGSLKHNSQLGSQAVIQGIQLVPSSSIAGNIRASSHSSSHGSLKHNSQLGSKAVIQGIQLLPSSSIAGNIRASGHSSSYGSLRHSSHSGSHAVIQGIQSVPGYVFSRMKPNVQWRIVDVPRSKLYGSHFRNMVKRSAFYNLLPDSSSKLPTKLLAPILRVRSGITKAFSGAGSIGNGIGEVSQGVFRALQYVPSEAVGFLMPENKTKT